MHSYLTILMASRTTQRKNSSRSGGGSGKSSASKGGGAQKDTTTAQETETPEESSKDTATQKKEALNLIDSAPKTRKTAEDRKKERERERERKEEAAKSEQKQPRRSHLMPTISRIKQPQAAPEPQPRKAAKPEPEPEPEPQAEPEKEMETEVEAEAAPAPAPAPAETEAVDESKIIHIKPPIIVKDLAEALDQKPFKIIQELMKMDIFANINQKVEPDVAVKIAELYGYSFEVERREKGAGVHKEEVKVEEPPPPEVKEEEETRNRPPIVTIMGHVDHGKTSILDHIRKTRVADGEAGGITQHIGAYQIEHNGQKVTFLDTPGHQAFTAMRARGANVTDIVVLVVAADDGLMPQTIEAINHAKAAGVEIIIAVNKIDLPTAQPDMVKGQLQEYDLTPEDWGGSTICVECSAATGEGLDSLLEMIFLQAEILELQTPTKADPRGTVIEAQMESGRGATATIVVTHGEVKVGQSFICGRHWGKVKGLINDSGQSVQTADAATPVKVLGFNGLPEAGDEFVGMDSEKAARILSEERLEENRVEKLARPQRATLEDLFAKHGDAGKKSLQLILKADVQGSLEAVVSSLKDIKSEKVELDIIHAAAGPVSESDILLASASDAVVIGFNVKLESTAVAKAKAEGVQVKLFSIIYELIDQVEQAMLGLLDPEHRENIIGHAEVKEVFKLTKGTVAGCLVTEGRIDRNARARVVRGKQSVYDGHVATLKRFKDDVKEVRLGLECGIKLGDYSEYEEGDIIECYLLERLEQTL